MAMTSGQSEEDDGQCMLPVSDHVKYRQLWGQSSAQQIKAVFASATSTEPKRM